jgi:hypothetical protein
MMSPELMDNIRRNPRYGRNYFEDYGPENGGVPANSQNQATTSSPTHPNYTQEGDAFTTGAASNSPSNIGTLDYDSAASGNYSASSLPAVTDPDKAFADVGLRQHQFLVREFRPFEEALIESVNDTSLVDAVPEEVEEQARISQEIDERNRSRYGYNRTAVEQQEVAREADRTKNIGLAGGLNNARLAQRERNHNLLAQLVNIGQGLNRASLGQMGAAADMAVGRRNAYTQAKAQSKAQKWGFLGSL